jgi:hypothetical protein
VPHRHGLSGDFTDRTGFTLNNQMIPVGVITRATISNDCQRFSLDPSPPGGLCNAISPRNVF